MTPLAFASGRSIAIGSNDMIEAEKALHLIAKVLVNKFLFAMASESESSERRRILSKTIFGFHKWKSRPIAIGHLNLEETDACVLLRFTAEHLKIGSV